VSQKFGKMGAVKKGEGKNESFTQQIKKALKIGVTSRQLSKYCNEWKCRFLALQPQWMYQDPVLGNSEMSNPISHTPKNQSESSPDAPPLKKKGGISFAMKTFPDRRKPSVSQMQGPLER
jgi:hypothetical protein